VTGGTLILEGLEEGIYNVVAYYDGNGSYSKVSNSTQFKVIRDLAYYVEISNFTSTERSINITAKSNINNNLINGKLYFILPDSSKKAITVFENGTYSQISPPTLLTVVTPREPTLKVKPLSVLSTLIRAHRLPFWSYSMDPGVLAVRSV
jgi:hypothetical protein